MAKDVQSKGLAKAREIYHNQEQRAGELKGGGKKVIGYLCCYPPLELFTAADLVPYRISGDMREPVTRADTYVETMVCTFLRSCYDLAFKGKFDFLDSVVMPHACDGTEKLYPVWRLYFNPGYSYLVNIPHIVASHSYEFLKAELNYFKKTLEEFTGVGISNQDLREAIQVHNQNRALLRELNELRKEEPPLVTGTEMTQIMVAVMNLPVEEGNELLREIIREVKERPERPEKKARLFFWGSPIDDIAFMQAIEESGANVVMDDTCFGTRHYWWDVEITEDPFEGLATRYLDKIPCPRTFRGTTPEERLGYILDYMREFKANGAVLYVLRHCDNHAFDLPDLRDLIKGAGLPVLSLVGDYTVGGLMGLRTRVQAFVEMLG